MSNSKNQLWQQLHDKHLVQGTLPQTASSSPWYIKVLLGFSGWIGALFILLFVFTAFGALADSPIACLFTSLPLFAISYVVLSKPNNEFFEHVALAISLAAQGLVVFALSQWLPRETIWLACAVLQWILAVLMPSFLHRVFSTVIASLSMSVYLMTLGVVNVLPSLLTIFLIWLCINEFRFVNRYRLISGFMYGVTLSIILLQSASLFSIQPQDFLWGNELPSGVLSPWDGYFLYVCAMCYGAWQLLKLNHVSLHSTLAKLVFGLVLVFTVLSVNAQGIGLGLLILLLGFTRSNHTLLGIGIAGLVLYCAAYYYLLEETLLAKSGMLLLIAVFAFVCRQAVHHFSLAKGRG